ncbi:endopeptidase La [Geobacter argillaceus]|uniref:Lon protease n=1 Tax=Geobacter argillaceus TaxID=345631 RepID=A0A562VHJ9_9BACT|nr:endopeptidase La [Geobacter argillaceus]TWJ17342.1 ATP-dependent proteinase [Geobacter argillaceus]
MSNKPVVESTTIAENRKGEPIRFPLLPLRDLVLFPSMVVPLFVGRERSVQAIEAAMGSSKLIFMATQKSAKTEEPSEDDIYRHGTICQIIQVLKLPDGTVKILVEGKSRGKIDAFVPHPDYFLVEAEETEENNQVTPTVRALMRELLSVYENYASLTKASNPDLQTALAAMPTPGALADTLAAQLTIKLPDKQKLLATAEPARRLERLISFMTAEIEILELEKKIRGRVKKQMEKNQREYYLNEQLKAIQKELGKKDESAEEYRELEERISRLNLSKEALQKAQAELKKLRLMSPVSAEAAVVRNYLDWLTSLPWGTLTEEKNDIRLASRVLDEDHYGLDKVKQRILEYLSVNTLVKRIKGPILCLVGPPGVGKTSLARSIARSTGRTFVKMSLGGMRDEAEIRGHRRTYVGAMPGKIIQNLKRAGSDNPVFLLDEIDKMSSDFRGDPASALLEVLDPEQNATFSDLFLDTDYNLSQVMFVTTANTLHTIPRPLLDRLEVIRLAGYTELEKLAIAKQYLLKKQLEAHGLADREISVSDRAVMEIIRYYTREAGVRNLEREIAGVCRKLAHRAVEGKKLPKLLQPHHVAESLGARKFRIDSVEQGQAVGLVTGLAWTETGGELLIIEVSVLHGKGQLTITGKLGEVMRESVQAAVTYVRSRAHLLGLDKEFYQNSDIHIHVPEGAIPKDGPSAGITIASAIISALTGSPVSQGIAMTGEITLRGRVLAIGGLKEKLMAARRGGIKLVLIPEENRKDLDEVPKEVMAGLTVTCVSHMDEVLHNAFGGVPVCSGSVRTITGIVTDHEPVTAH